MSIIQNNKTKTSLNHRGFSKTLQGRVPSSYTELLPAINKRGKQAKNWAKVLVQKPENIQF